MKLMVVDDNAQIRDGICRGIDWAAYGFEEVRDYADGREAGRALEEFAPDVIIADICMPGMDGLELLGYVREHLKRCKYILLSAYSEFTYAQRAIRLGADDYILKPVKPGKLIELVVRCREELVQLGRESASYLEAVEKSLLHSLTVEGSAPDFGRLKILLEEKYGLILRENLLYVGVVQLAGDEEAGADALAFREILAERLQPDACVLSVSGGRLLLLGRGLRSQAANYESFSRLKGKVEALRRDGQGAVIGAVGISDVRSLREADAAYAHACDALKAAYYLEKGVCAVYGEDGQRWKSGIGQERKKRFRDGLAGALRQRDGATLAAFFAQMREWGFKERFDPEETALFLSGLWREGCAACGVEIPWTLPEGCGFGRQLEAMEERLRAVLRYAQEPREGVSDMVAAVCEYLNAHYREPVTVEAVAQAFSRTPNYISAKFKREMGKSFTDYLMDIRIRKAVFLLENTALPVQSVAEEAGFGSYDYFSRMLRKNTGQSAGEIRGRKK